MLLIGARSAAAVQGAFQNVYMRRAVISEYQQRCRRCLLGDYMVCPVNHVDLCWCD